MRWGRATEYIYDDLGRVIKTLFADGTSATSTYDQLGRRNCFNRSRRKSY